MKSAAPAVSSERTHLYWIDWMRFLAAALVLLEHACDANWIGQEVPPDPHHKTLFALLAVPVHLGREAVVVFFVLSGALVGGLTLRQIRAGTFDLAGYASDRLARIYVPLIPALLWTAASVRMLDDPVLPLQHLGCVFGLQGVMTHNPYANGAVWSLAYEMWFYVLAGCVGVLATWGHRTPGGRLAALAAGALALGILCFRLDPVYLGCWLLGAAGMPLATWMDRPSTRRWATVAGLAAMFVGVAGFFPDLLASTASLEPLSRWSWRANVADLTLAAGALLFFAGVCRSAPATHAGTWLERLGTPLAAFSYTLYLTHLPLLRILASTSTQMPQLVTWYTLFRLSWWLALCVAVAVVMYVLFEVRTPLVRRWLRVRLTAVPPGEHSPAPDEGCLLPVG